ncbi:MAG: radical SAM protein [Candidatus Hatepunaea meridiana]|nr:radical SAM protein [Candidatus Hatepunaea meridiana]
MYTYGPVPSRRLGRSLGVSPIPPGTCTYSCVYCQCGRTTHLTDKRVSFFPKNNLLSEIDERLKTSDADCLTFVGDGEPTLSKDLGWLISNSKQLIKLRQVLTPDVTIPIAVITNSSLLYQPEVRDELRAADIALPSLDAGSEKIFNKVNRPHGRMKYDNMLQGIIDFSNEYNGKIWMEVMLVHGINDTDEALKDIRNALNQIKHDRLYITTPTRPPTESWVLPLPPEDVIRAQEILGQSIVINKKEIGRFGIESFDNAQQAVLEISSRHPLRLEQAFKIEGTFSENGTVEKMIDRKELVRVLYNSTDYVLPRHLVKT